MKTHCILSIIIPVYKVEKYLEHCLQSIISQIHENVDIILVDDGSPDSCPQICDKWASKYSYIRVIHQQNQGLSMARNIGLEAAKGDYIWFVDSDDWLLPSALNDVFSAIRKYPDIDVVASYMRKYYEQSKRYEDVQSQYYGQLFCGKEYMRHCPKGASQRFVYKRAFIMNNDLRFYPGVLHEDGIWGYMMLYLAKSVYMLERPIYVYRLRSEGSIMSNIKVKSAYDLIKGHEVLVEFMYNKVRKEDHHFFRYQIYEMIICSFLFCRKLFHTTEYKEFLQKNKMYIRKETFKVCIIRPYLFPEFLLCGTPYYFIKYKDFKQNIKAFAKKLLRIYDKKQWWNNSIDWFKQNWRLLTDIEKFKKYYSQYK